ncbi:gamma-tubulin complex component 6 [Megalops cyprinoides]|uniref:gamma-tubulin complex component 6 n=1 Tax=Megalops cyprinoides TaxID=118141 RepID=UPI00186537F7|nr:gamma-tubulin complex component 6 [Megalops cyprinoides]
MYSSASSSSSITELLGALCDTCVSGVSWKRRAWGAGSREGVRRALRKRAYGALLSKLFQEGSPKGTSAASAAASTPPRNKMLMISFNLRVAGCQAEAERLEELLGMLGEGRGCGVGELDSVLELLVQLAGSVPPPPASFSRDYMRRERPVQRRPALGGYQSEELQRLEARAWALVCGEEWGALGGLRGTLGLMDAPPGTGLLALGQRYEAEERFEKETRLSLFGALQHTRTSDLDIRLDLPPVPSNAEVTGLAIRVPPCLDQSEDEGFQSASNLTPDSQSEPSPSPELDVWEALRSFQPGRRRCWERVGCPPGSREEPYLTEAGREAFDQLYRLWEGEMRVVGTAPTSPLLPLPLDSQTQLVGDLLNVLIGVASATFPLNQVSMQFEVRPGVCVSGASPESVSRLLAELAQYGTHYLRLSRFSLHSAHRRGLVFQAFTGGLRRYLHYYRACVLSAPPTLSLLTIGFLFRKLGRQLRYLSELCCVDGVSGVSQATFPVGVKLLSYLYNEAQSNCSNENYPVLLSLLKSSCEPYTRFVSDWVYSGVFRDVYGEFMIQVNEDYLSFRDKHFWTQGYTLISRDVEECVPVFLRHIANDVYVCGKTINLLKICCPQHYICWSELAVPRIAVTFSLQEVEEIERDCAVYRGRMERIAKHSAVSREEQALRTERARQELISQVRASTAKTLESIRGRQVSQRLAEEAKKRERFEELKQQLEQEQEWRNAAKRKEEEDDFGFARELRDREKRLQALEEELERRARKELIAQYSRLSEEAARREQRAMWRVQRMRLDEARQHFLQVDRRLTQDLLEKYPLGQQRPPTDILPTVASKPQPAQSPERCERQEQEKIEDSPDTDTPPDPALGDEALISDELDINDFLPKPRRPPDSQQVDRALQDIGSDLQEEAPAAQSQDYDFSAPYSPLQGGPPRPHWGPVVKPNIGGGENMAEGQEVVSSPSMHQGLPEVRRRSQEEPSSAAVQLDHGGPAPQTGSGLELLQQPGQGADDQAGQHQPPEEKGRASAQSVETPSQEDTVSEAEAGVPQIPVLGEPTSSRPDEGAARGTDTGAAGDQCAKAPPTPGKLAHPSDAAIKVGSFVSEVADPVPTPSIHGHASEAHIRVGEHVSEVTDHIPSPSIHGHASDAHIRVGEHVSEVVTPFPSPSIHGHASDAHIRVGEHVSEVVTPLPSPSVHGHASDANIRVGGFVSEVTPSRPRWNKHGHSSDCTLKVGCVVSGSEPSPSPLPGSAYGHSSDSTLTIGCVVSGTEPFQSPLPGSAYGHSSDSTLGIGCVVLGTEPAPSPLPGSAYGHSSDSGLGAGCVVMSSEQLPSPLPGGALPPQGEPTPDAPAVPGQSAEGPEAGPHGEQQQLVEGISAWVSPGERSEQDYLLSLAAQYEVEQYQDSYTLMTLAPDSQLLQQVTRGPSGLPADLSLRRATDTTAVQLSEMVSLPVLMKHSVTTPLITHVSLVNKAVVDYFFVELRVESHFEALRHFLLMEDGEFAQSLSDLLFEKLGSGQTPGELLTPLVLNSILNKALQYSLHGDSELAANFTFALRFLPETFHPLAPDALNCLELRYKVDWPLNIIITDSCMNKYNRLFSFLLQLKHMVWTLRDVWFHLKRAALVKGAGGSVQFRQLQLYRHEMQHFVKVIQGYIANQILQVSWSEFTNKLGSASDLDAIHHTHADYLNRAIFRGLLTEKAAPVMNIIHSIFSLILKFRAQLIAHPWSSQQGEVVHPSFVALQQSYNTFKYYSHFLFKVVTKLVNRGYQPHLEDFLLRINFNNYYKETSP